MLNIDTDIIYRINYGKAHKLQNQTYPIRKELSEKEIRANKIKDLLKENKLNNKQIADMLFRIALLFRGRNYAKFNIVIYHGRGNEFRFLVDR